jgi:hypothetical protein
MDDGLWSRFTLFVCRIGAGRRLRVDDGHDLAAVRLVHARQAATREKPARDSTQNPHPGLLDQATPAEV